MITLETARLIVKPHALANAEKFAAWENDPELVWLNEDTSDLHQVVTVDQMRRYIHQLSQPDPDDDHLELAIHRKSDDAFIGYAMLAEINLHHRRCKIGITIGEKSEWGKGYAHEALEAILDHCFQTLALNRVVAEIYCFNDRSIRLFEGLGFQREGLLRQSVWKNGQYIDDCAYALLHEQWEHRASPLSAPP